MYAASGECPPGTSGSSLEVNPSMLTPVEDDVGALPTNQLADASGDHVAEPFAPGAELNDTPEIR